MYFAIVLLSVIASSLSQRPFNLPCPIGPTIENFNQTKVLGQWYVQLMYADCHPRGRCSAINFIDNGDGSMEVVTKQLSVIPNEFTYYTTSNRVQGVGRGVYTVASPEDPRFAELPVNKTADFWETDYVNYALIGRCVSFGTRSLHWISGLTRVQNLSDSSFAALRKSINEIGAFPDSMERIDQTNCPDEY